MSIARTISFPGARFRWLVAVLLITLGQAAQSQVQHDLPLVMSASNLRQQGFVRIINRSNLAGSVSIEAIDDTGRRFGPIYLSLDAKEAVQFNSRDLERGNSGVGLSEGVGEGAGNWRLELESTLDIEPLAYIRTRDGFLTSMHEVAREVAPMRYRVPIFNPGRNRSLVSWLRLINPGRSSASIVISGLDARGNAAPGGDVRLTLGAGSAREVTSRQLESGASGLSGRLGQGTGKWQLSVSSDSPIQAMGLMETRSGHLTNLSRGVAPGQRTIPLVLPASDLGRQGFVRIINRSNRAGSVSIEAIDDTGRHFEPVFLSLDPKGAVQFNSRDLERGNSDIGLSRGVGDGTGNWRLELETTLDIESLAYIRTSDGFLTSMHETAAAEGTSMRYRVPIFNPGSNRSLPSWLRLINPGERAADITIDALDARGDSPPRGRVRLRLPPGAARTLTAQQLEEGARGLSGRFGSGTGKWQLFVSARTPILVMGLMETRSRHLTNLSGTSMEPVYPGSAPVAHDVSLSGDASTPYVEAQLIGTDPDGDTLMYVLDGPSTGPGYRDAFILPDSGQFFAELEPAGRSRVEIPYVVTDGTRFSEPARVIVTIEETSSDELGDVPQDPLDYGDLDLDYFDTSRIPRSVDLSGSFPVPGSQGRQGSCVGWATAYALKSYQERVEEGWAFTPSTTFSPAWIYNQVKDPGPCNNPHDPYDCGSRISDALDLIISKGAAPWSTMPYTDRDYRTRPSFRAEQEAARFKALGKRRVASIQHLKGALANRHPIVIGMPVYQSFYRLSGRGSVYNDLRGSISGHHAVTLVGYDDDRFGGAFKVINSWGTGWGDRGYFWLPYSIYFDSRFDAFAYLLVDGPNDDDGQPLPPTPPPCGRGDNRPNLVAKSWTAEYSARPGGSGTWTYEVQNTGSATAPAGVDVNLILSRDRRADASDYWVTYEEIPFALRPGWSAVRDEDNPLSFRFPETIPAGTYYMAMWVDDVNEVRECDETDNVAYGRDLVRFHFTLPDIAVENWWAQWGRYTGTGELHYRVTNLGTSTIRGTDWDINLFLHTRLNPADPQGRGYYLFYEDASYALEPGAVIYRDSSNPASFNLFRSQFGTPVASGTYYMSLWVDDLDQVRESNEWNNVSVGRNLVTIRRSAEEGQKQSEGVDEATTGNAPKDSAWQSTFNGKVLPGQLTRKVKIVDHDDGSRQLIFLDNEPQSLPPPSATVGKPKSGKQEAGAAYEKTNQSEDIIVFPRVNVVKMP